MFTRILRFLLGTQTLALTYRSEDTKDAELPKELQDLLKQSDIAVLTDISFAPRKETRSIQMIVACAMAGRCFGRATNKG